MYCTLGLYYDCISRIINKKLLAHLWGAYAVPLALSVVRRELSVVCRLCPP